MRVPFRIIAASCLQLAAATAGASAWLGGSGPTAVRGTPLYLYSLKDGLGQPITFYVSRPKSKRAPLLLMIQGSGCVPVMAIRPSGTYSTLFDFLPFAKDGQFAVMAVEKPYDGIVNGGNPGTALPCSRRFDRNFSAETWLSALQAALDAARRLPWIDRKRTLVFGISEGATMASLLAAHDRYVTDVVMIGGSGTTQVYDFVVSAYQRCSDVPKCLAHLYGKVRDIYAHPDSATRFAWGHPYKRWASFIRIDPAEELLHSNARVYWAFGSDDTATPPLSAEVGIARLRVTNHDLTVRRVDGANHMLMKNGQYDFVSTDKEFRAALKWFWSGGVTAR
jgi:pimeloyl-ACP methyl ester carboxylesterase